MSTYTFNNEEMINALIHSRQPLNKWLWMWAAIQKKLVTVLVENMETSKYTLHACLVAQSCPTLWIVACQAPLSMAFPRQEYWSELQFSSSRVFSRPRDTNHISYVSYIAGRFFTHWAIEKWKVLVAQSCPTLGGPMDCGFSGSSVHGFFRQEYWSGLPFPSPWDLPDPGIKLGCPTFQEDSLQSEPSKALLSHWGSTILWLHLSKMIKIREDVSRDFFREIILFFSPFKKFYCGSAAYIVQHVYVFNDMASFLCVVLLFRGDCFASTKTEEEVIYCTFVRLSHDWEQNSSRNVTGPRQRTKWGLCSF